ncbi:MAG: prepilin-type N-terminal cleavage/methylation domain-containing protein [Myxococcota bacterium]
MNRTKRTAGFTLIEVMMGMSVMVVGALGIMAMQQAAMTGNMNARQVTTATQSTELWLERVRRDSLAWNTADAATGLGSTFYLRNAPLPGGPSVWFTPAGGLPGESSAFDYFGMEVPLAQGRYCTQMQLTWIDPGRLMRVDLRTWWHRRGDGTATADATLFPNCGSGAEAAVTTELNASPSRLHAVYASTLVRWQRLPQ